MSAKPYFRTDYRVPPPGTNVIWAEQSSYENSRRNRAQPELSDFVKAPALPDDFSSQVANLDKAVYGRGLAIDAEKLLSLGKVRFQQLLSAEREARPSGNRPLDLVGFESIQLALQAWEAPSVPRLKTHEQMTGSGKDREAARAIQGFEDFWKFSSREPAAVRNIYAAHDLFRTLCFGQSMLERSDNGRLRSRFLCGGRGSRVELLWEWASVLKGPLQRVTLTDPLFRLMAWLSEETAEPPSALELARNWFFLRAPSNEQVRLAQAVLGGFLMGESGWRLWDHVGRATRCLTDPGRVTAWAKELADHCPAITAWHRDLRAQFYKEIRYGLDERRQQFEAPKHRAYLDSLIEELLEQAGALLALGIEDAKPGALCTRFQTCALIEADQKLTADEAAPVSRLLDSAFPGSNFQLAIEEVKP